MNFPPSILDLRIDSPERERPLHLWLPLFLLWPLALALIVVSLALTILVDLVLFLIGQSYHDYTILLLHSLEALCETRGMYVSVNDGKATVSVTVQ
jgi:hypothetical protein